MTASWMTACHWWPQMPRSCRACTTTPPPRSLHSPGMDADLSRVLSNTLEELGLEWSPPEEPSRSRLDEWFLPGRLFPEVHDEITKSRHAPTYPVYMPLLPPPSLRSTAQKKRVTTACLPFMSQWPCISVRPWPLAEGQKLLTHLSNAGLLQLSLNEPIHRLDRWPRLFTPWCSCKCFKSSQVTFIYIALLTIQIVSKQLHNIKIGFFFS